MDADLRALESEVASGPIPRHVAIIMDGNGRWAQERGKHRLEGHAEGARSVRVITRAARRLGVQALTLYAFSAQNWARPSDEVEGLMELLRDYLLSEREELLENDIRLQAVGELSRLPRKVVEPLAELQADTSGCGAMTLTLCLSYGGREELVDMARTLAEDVSLGRLRPDEVDAEQLQRRLWTGALPDPDLLIRTSGERRISNFLLWGCAYAELYFEEAPWPEFRDEAFLRALQAYQGRERRFGLTGAQVHGPDGL